MLNFAVNTKFRKTSNNPLNVLVGKIYPNVHQHVQEVMICGSFNTKNVFIVLKWLYEHHYGKTVNK